MFIDPHVHSSGISLCSRVTCEQIIDFKRSLGYDGVVLTNHCQPWYYEPEEHSSRMKSFVEEFKKGALYARKLNFRFILGIEVTINVPVMSDWLLYGVTEEFLLSSPCLYMLTQKQLFELCEKNGIFLVQAHPIRHSPEPCSYLYTNGVEINCTPGDFEKRQEVIDFARKHNLKITCGTDFHNIDRDCKSGMVIPDDIFTSRDFAKYLFETKNTELVFDGEKHIFNY